MEDSRKSLRYAMRCRCALVFENKGRRETIQCRINDISISGVSVICHRNIPYPLSITLYFLVDPGNRDHPRAIVEAQGRIMDNVFSGQQEGFRLSIRFSKFVGDGQQVLIDYLANDKSASRKKAAVADPPRVATL